MVSRRKTLGWMHETFIWVPEWSPLVQLGPEFIKKCCNCHKITVSKGKERILCFMEVRRTDCFLIITLLHSRITLFFF